MRPDIKEKRVFHKMTGEQINFEAKRLKEGKRLSFYNNKNSEVLEFYHISDEGKVLRTDRKHVHENGTCNWKQVSTVEVAV